MMREDQGLSSSSSSSRCQDCGNQAKKDCTYMRCRTCCKGRGFQCETHVKSTWVPVSTRRPRHHLHHHQHLSTTIQQQQQQLQAGPNPKRYRANESQVIGDEEEGGDFPGEVSFPAVFRCIRVSSIDNMVDQYAYQTSVKIAGHVFKGILYDQGPDHHHESPRYNNNIMAGESSSSGFHLQQPPNLPTSTAAAATTCPHPSASTYPNLFNALNMPGTQFFQYPKSS
ncbi:hypothetical protein HAX54_045126 [Datura stramonium]|uniref:Uncharacterized protein n=1 Tax=Datura stramonium TaxID=4076 RepID=A0ABS8WFH3_DATST|nr:hypothetical protein [Datura stramonium]